MRKIVYDSILHLVFVLPLISLFLRKYSKENIIRVMAFIFIYVVDEILLNIPKIYPSLIVITGNWNWTGKLFSIIFGLSCYFLFKYLFREHDFFSLKQDRVGVKQALIVSVVVILLATIIWFVFGHSEFDIETLAFQLTLPGIDEEILYRGILLGLLMSGLKENVKFIGNPSILISSILFGIMHALKLNEHLSPNFNLIYFLQTGLAGYAWGYVAVKSKSVLLPVFSHNLSNFFGTLVMMTK